MKCVWLYDWETYRSAVLLIQRICERTTHLLFVALEATADDNGYMKMGRLLVWKDNFRSSCHSYKFTNLWVLLRRIVWTLLVFEFMNYKKTSENTEVLAHAWIFFYFTRINQKQGNWIFVRFCQQFYLALDHIMLKCTRKLIFLA